MDKRIVMGMIEDVETGRLITTDVRPVEPDDFRAWGQAGGSIGATRSRA